MSKKSFSLICLILPAIVLLLSVLAIQAQTVTGSIKGNVTDTSNAIVPGVSIEIVNVETGLKRDVETNADGAFQATFLPLGKYKVTASKNGFGTIIRENIEVTLNQTSAVDFKIDPTVSATVTIEDEPAAINTTNAQIAGTLSSQQITERPVLNQGNFLTLAETFTGFQENPTSGQNNPTASSGSSINFNGTGSRGATFQINGVNNDDSSENQNRQGASLATIKEFQVITNNFTAEFGRGYGAVVLVQTKQGTNNIRGEAYIYHNDSALNARSFFGTTKPVNRRNQFGAVGGFPIFKNKLFGFLSLDHLENTGANNYRRDIFTAAEKNSANWFQQTPANNTPQNRAFIQSVINRFGSLAPNDPDSRNFRTYNGQQGFDFPARDYSARFDWNAGQSDNIFVRYQYTRQRFNAEDIILGERADQNNKQQNYGLTWTHNFTSNLVGEFRYGLGLRTTLVNIAAGNDTPVIRFLGSPVSTSIIGNAGNFPIQRYQTDNQIVYNVSTNLGSSHFVKFGTDIRRQQLDDLADNFSRGFYNISATCNGVNYVTSYNAFLNGCVNNYQKGYGPFFLENRINETNFYAEDNWKVRSNLTLNIGARYEFVSAPKEKENRINYGYGADKDNIEPRLGFAYSPSFGEGLLGKIFGNPGESSIRGGYGIYHGRIFQSVFSQSGATVRFNPPNAFFYNQTGNATAGFNPTNLSDPTSGFVFAPGEPTLRYARSNIDPGLEMPYTQQWNLTFERQLLWKSAVRISYSGNRGIGLLRFALENLPDNNPAGVTVANHPNNAPSALYSVASLPANDPRRVDVRGQILRPAADVQCAGTGLSGIAVTTACPVAVPIAANEYSFRLPRTNERRPDGRFSTNSQVSNSAWSYYHGLQIEVNKRLSDGLNFQASYTFSKSIDTTSDATFLGAGDTNQTGNGSRLSRGLSRNHTPHRFTFFGTYRIPFFDKRRDWVGQIIGGWQTSLVFKWVHGVPFTVINGSGADLNLDGFAESRPVLIDPSVYGRTIGNINDAETLLPRTAFRGSTIADFGCCILGRNTFYADGVKTVDLAFAKSFAMPFERHRLYLRADLFNAFNHVQFSFPNTDFTTATFGRITGGATQYAPRSIQVSLRYSF